jgi:hypothetical protein
MPMDLPVKSERRFLLIAGQSKENVGGTKPWVAVESARHSCVLHAAQVKQMLSTNHLSASKTAKFEHVETSVFPPTSPLFPTMYTSLAD